MKINLTGFLEGCVMYILAVLVVIGAVVIVYMYIKGG